MTQRDRNISSFIFIQSTITCWQVLQQRVAGKIARYYAQEMRAEKETNQPKPPTTEGERERERANALGGLVSMKQTRQRDRQARIEVNEEERVGNKTEHEKEREGESHESRKAGCFPVVRCSRTSM